MFDDIASLNGYRKYFSPSKAISSSFTFTSSCLMLLGVTTFSNVFALLFIIFVELENIPSNLIAVWSLSFTTPPTVRVLEPPKNSLRSICFPNAFSFPNKTEANRS